MILWRRRVCTCKESTCVHDTLLVFLVPRLGAERLELTEEEMRGEGEGEV